MIWLNPAALFAIAAVAVPILIHLLVHRRAERFPFPTLRFLQPTRLAAMRHRMLDDIALLVVRMSILALAALAFAGPLVVTPGRRAAWNTRLVRAVASASSAVQPSITGDPAFLTQRFDEQSLRDAIHSAVAWLDRAPPARRELLIAGPLSLGSIVDADLASVPSDIGIRFERSGDLPAERVVAAAPVMVAAADAARDIRTHAEIRSRALTIGRPRTSVRDETAGTPATWPVDVIARDDARAAVEAAIAAVLEQRVRAPIADRKTRLVIADRGITGTAGLNDAGPIRSAWMADAVAKIASEGDLRGEISREAQGFEDTRFAGRPWQPLVVARDGRPIVSAAASADTLTIASAAAADSLVTPILLRAIVNSVAPDDEPRGVDVLPIPDDQLRTWTRPPIAVTFLRMDTIDRDDRRWLWGVVLALLAVEWWMRRTRRADLEKRELEAARVA